MDILVCSIQGQRYGLDLNKVQSVVLAVESTELPNAPDYFLGAINVHGEITLVVDMRKLFGLPIKELEINDHFILCKIHKKQVALWVDQVKHIKHYREEEFIPAEQVLPELSGLQYVLKEEGQITLVYDLEKILPSNVISLGCGSI